MKNLSIPDVHRMNLCFTCVALSSAKARLDHNVPVWRYRYFGDWDNIRVGSEAGAFHGSELSLVFGTPKRFESRVKSTPEQVEVEKLMMSTWAGFARDPLNFLPKLGWPRYKQDEKTLVQIAYENSPKVSFAYPNDYDKECSTVYELSDDSLDHIMGRSGENDPKFLLSAYSGPSPKAAHVPT
jgi:cholinesterase